MTLAWLKPCGASSSKMTVTPGSGVAWRMTPEMGTRSAASSSATLALVIYGEIHVSASGNGVGASHVGQRAPRSQLIQRICGPTSERIYLRRLVSVGRAPDLFFVRWVYTRKRGGG